jgi:fructuronate reductase
MGPGIFHRAHQAVYIDDVLTRQKDWAICGISLNSATVRNILKYQDFLYTLAILDREISFRIIGAIKDVLVAPRQPQQVLRLLSTPDIKILSLTITEKGYCLDVGGNLDVDHPAIRRDLSSPSAPASAIGYIARSLELRRNAGVRPYTVVSCDNLSENGIRLARAVRQYAAQFSPDLAKWIEDEVRFVCTMVDSITPYSDDTLKSRVAGALSVADGWPVQREAFTQWVIEDDFTLGRPDWEPFGVIMTRNVGAFEQAKLRLLNAAHSALAYLGLLAGFDTVYEAMGEEKFARYLHDMMTGEILPGLAPPPGLDLPGYRDAILRRFRNPVIKHLLSQIALDGSQKLPIRVLGTISDNLAAGRPIGRLCLIVAAWMRFAQARAAQGAPIEDPLAKEIARAARHPTGDGAAVDDFLALRTVFPNTLKARPDFRDGLRAAYLSLGKGRRPDILAALNV